MRFVLKHRKFSLLNFLILIFIVLAGVFFEYPSFSETQKKEMEFRLPEFFLLQGNTLLPLFHQIEKEKKEDRKLLVIVTAYSSSYWETDETPYITAAGTLVREGVVANNYLPLGTKIKIPQLFGDKIFVVEDRMSWKKGNYHIDIWFPDYWQALNFGVKKTYIEILDN